jgi:hypothetical protein
MQLSHEPCREHGFPFSPLVCVCNLLPSYRHCLAADLHATVLFMRTSPFRGIHMYSVRMLCVTVNDCVL